jgi:hypothetical protein
MPAGGDITPDNFWDHVPQPDFGELWRLPANPWFKQMTANAADAIWRGIVLENWPLFVTFFFVAAALIIVPRIIHTFRWGPGVTVDKDTNQAGWKL